MSQAKIRLPLLGSVAAALLLGACGPSLIIDSKAGTGLRVVSFSFSPDEKQLAYSAGDWNKKGDEEEESAEDKSRDGSFHVSAVPPSGKAKMVEVRGCTFANTYRLRWAHKGKRLAVAARDALYVFSPKGKKWAPVSLVGANKDCDSKEQTGDIQSMAWSPNDDLIAYSTVDRDLFTVPSEGGSPNKIDVSGLNLEPQEKVTILEWSDQGLVVKKGAQVLSLDTETKQATLKHELGPKDDWVTAAPNGALYVVTSTGVVETVRASGVKPILQAPLKRQLQAKSKKKNATVQHKFLIEVSPSGKTLAVAEWQSEKDSSGSSILYLVPLPGGKGKEESKKAKKKASAQDDEAAADEDAAPRKKVKRAAAEETDATVEEDAAPKKKKAAPAVDSDDPK